MRKIILLFIFFIPFSVNAQLFEGGFEGGLVASQVDGDLQAGYHKIGLSLLGFAKLNISQTLSLTSGTGYVIKGARSGSKQAFFNTSLHYAEIPLLININPTALRNLSFSAGIVYGYLIAGRYDDGASVHSANTLNLRKSEFSSQFSLNYDFSDNITIRLTNNYSLAPITKPYSRNCWQSNIFMALFYKNKPATPCWWNNNLRLTIQYKLYDSNKNKL